MSDPRPILFFDSGVGGLSVLAEARALLPQASVVYVADSAGFPYGTRSEAEIAARVPALLGRLAERYRPRLIVIACNTASTIALPSVRAALDLPIVGTVPAIKPAAALSRTRTIGVLGTDATVRQPYVDRLAAEFAADCTVLRHGSAELVLLAEARLTGRNHRARGVPCRARRAVRSAREAMRSTSWSMPARISRWSPRIWRTPRRGRHLRRWQRRDRAQDRDADRQRRAGAARPRAARCSRCSTTRRAAWPPRWHGSG